MKNLAGTGKLKRRVESVDDAGINLLQTWNMILAA